MRADSAHEVMYIGRSKYAHLDFVHDLYTTYKDEWWPSALASEQDLEAKVVSARVSVKEFVDNAKETYCLGPFVEHYAR